MSTYELRIEAPEFVAAVVVRNWRVIEAKTESGPDLLWAVGKPSRYVLRWAKRNGYQFRVLRVSMI